MPTTADYLQSLTDQKSALAENLNAKGVEADASELFNTLIPKVLDIDCRDHIRFGFFKPSENLCKYEIDLPFKPQRFFAFNLDAHKKELNGQYGTAIFALDTKGNFKSFFLSRNVNNDTNITWTANPSLFWIKGNKVVYNDLFQKFYLTKDSVYFWAALSEDYIGEPEIFNP